MIVEQDDAVLEKYFEVRAGDAGGRGGGRLGGMRSEAKEERAMACCWDGRTARVKRRLGAKGGGSTRDNAIEVCTVGKAA